jgi:putative transposase
LGYSRQSYYKRKEIEIKRLEHNQMIKNRVQELRSRQTKVGGKKLHRHLNEEGIPVGRDRLFDLLRFWGLLIHKKKRFHKTTNSKHHFRKYSNLIKERPPKKIHEVYVSDITYIKTLEGFWYLYLITDMYSRKIVGHAFKNNLTADGTLESLDMALKQWPGGTKLIHHSDRGIQYCCHDYVDRLMDAGVQISMTEDNHVYENSLAERVNGILKDEFLLDHTIESSALAKRLVLEAIEIYNNERLHMSLGYRTPSYVHSN